MLRWTLYILRRLANLLGDPVDATLCQVFERAEEEKMVIGVRPVRARCGYRLCLTQRQATHPNVAVLLKGDFE